MVIGFIPERVIGFTGMRKRDLVDRGLAAVLELDPRDLPRLACRVHPRPDVSECCPQPCDSRTFVPLFPALGCQEDVQVRAVSVILCSGEHAASAYCPWQPLDGLFLPSDPDLRQRVHGCCHHDPAGASDFLARWHLFYPEFLRAFSAIPRR